VTSIEYLTVEATDPAAADRFYAALGLETRVRARASDAPSTGFRGFTLSLVVSQPSTVTALVTAGLGAGATTLKAAEKSLWGFGGVIQGPDGTIVTIASSTKKDTGPATTRIDDVVLQLGVADVGASKRFYVDRGLTATKSYGRRFVEFGEPGPVTMALLKRRALAKAAGVSPDGTGSHRIVVGSKAGPFTDPDGFVWESPSR
jgi:predicted lactoylglutathione lyase